MKIKSIYIDGLHNAVNKTYNFGDVNYIYGNNGIGKCRIGVDEYGNTIRMGLGNYIKSRCKFGPEEKGTSKTEDDFYPDGADNAKHIDPDKLAYILLSRKIITSRDYDFMLGKESFADWKQYNKNREQY